MSFRVSAPVAALAVLTLGSLAPVSAQPQAPVRPRYTAFQSIFSPGRPLLVAPGQGIQNLNGPAAFVNPLGPAPGFLYPNQALAYPQALPGAYAVNPALAPTGVVGSFNNLGHWYGPRSGYYGHWYPNGVASGAGVLGLGGGFGYAPTYGPTVGAGGFTRPATSLMGTTLMGAATINQLRR